MKIKTIIVDDEPLARMFLRQMLRDEQEVEIIGECADGYEAVAAVRKLSPDLLFLDVQMPEMDGFAVLEKLSGQQMPLVVFVTAYDQYALRAFEACALDYLLKPFDDLRFKRAMLRVKTVLKGMETVNVSSQIHALLKELKAKPSYLERLTIKANGRIGFLRVEEVDWVEAHDNYVKLHAKGTLHLLRETIANLASQLDPKKFLRIHRSAIVNIDSIRELQPMFHGEYRVILRNGTELTLSRRYRELARSILGKL